MPNFKSNRRRILQGFPDFFAFTIMGLETPHLFDVAHFHPEHRIAYHRDYTIIDEGVAEMLYLKVHDNLKVQLWDQRSRHAHDLTITIGRIVSSYPRHNERGYLENSPEPTFVLPTQKPPKPWLWVSAAELLREFTFSDYHPVHDVDSIILAARDPSKCYRPSALAAANGTT